MFSNLVFSYETKYELSLITYLLLIYVVVVFFQRHLGQMATLIMLEFCWECKQKYNQDEMGSWEVTLLY